MRPVVLALSFLLILSGCHRKADAPGEAPTGVTATAGDGLVVVNWDTLPDLTYWIFYEAGGSVAVDSPESTAIRRAIAPRAVGPLANETTYAFVMNATHEDSPAGPNSITVAAKPRLAGDNGSWKAGIPLGAPPQNLRGMTFTGSRFVLVGDAATILWGDTSYTTGMFDAPGTTPQGVATWTQVPPTSLPAGFASNLTSVVFNGVALVALGTDGSLVSSADVGVTWGPNNPISDSGAPVAGMNGIAFGNVFSVTPTYVAVGNGGKIFTSNDVVTWALRDSHTTSNLNSVTLINGIFFATGDAGTLLTSPNGIDWTPQTTGTTSTLRGATFTALTPAVHYVVVGDGGTVVTSPDATVSSWTAFALTGAPNLQGVTTGGASGTRFLAVGQGGAVAFSDDGVTWSQALAGSDNLTKVLAGNSLYLAIGDAGANVVSR